jgi:amidase
MAGTADGLRWMSATEQAALVRQGEATPLELLDAAIDRMERLNPAINAVTVSWIDEAREVARTLPDDGQPLRGVPILLKDLHAQLRGTPLTNGNAALKDAGYRCTETSAQVERLVRAGTVPFARANSCEFGSLPVTEPLAWGPTRNPWDASRTAGGSSGGSAAAVAAGIVPVAQSSDGGGSIRIPASCCGLVGLKPSQGRISMAPSRDEANLSVEHVVSRTVRDCAAFLDATHGPATGDRVIAPAPLRPYVDELERDPRPVRIGVLDHRFDGLPVHEGCVQAVRATASLLERLGHHVEEAWPSVLEDESFTPRFSALWSTNIAASVDWVSAVLGRELRDGDVEPVNMAMASFGRRFSAVDYASSVAATVQFRRAMQQWWTDGWDVLLSPVSSQPALPIGTLANDHADPVAPLRGTSAFLGFTAQFNASGQPAISVPLHEVDGVPVGVQFVGAYGREDLLLALAAQIERAAPWAHRRPAL